MAKSKTTDPRDMKAAGREGGGAPEWVLCEMALKQGGNHPQCQQRL